MNRSWGPHADEASYNRELRRRGIIFAADDPNFNVEVQRRILTSGDLFPVAFGEGAKWRKLEASECSSRLHHPRAIQAYATTVKYRGHESCCCLWSKPFTLIRPLENQWGLFPIDHRIAYARVCELMRARPELIISEDPPCYLSYGCIWKLYWGPEGPTPLYPDWPAYDDHEMSD